jgi:branched-chain amino acid transport system substrate-binding protein
MVNAEGGVNGRKIRFLSLDDGFSPEKAVELTRKLVEQDHVALVFGTVGSAINTSIQKYLNLGQVPQLLVGAGGNRFDDPGRYPWTTSFAPKVSTESRILANYVMTNNPAAKIAVLYQNDEFGKDELAGFRMALGDRADRMVIKELSYEITDPTVDTQVIQLQATGADTFFLIGFQRAASQALGKAYDLGWRPQRIVAYAASSAATAMKNAAEKARGVISVHFLKDPTDKRWSDDPGYLQWRAFMKAWYPDGSLDDIFVVSAYTQAQLLTYVLKQCGNDLSRENIMKQSTSIKDLELPMLLPGIKINTGPTQFSAVDQMELVRFDGESWLPLISAGHEK